MVEVTPDCSLKGEIDSVSWRGSKVAPLERTAEPRHGGMNGVVSPGPRQVRVWMVGSTERVLRGLGGDCVGPPLTDLVHHAKECAPDFVSSRESRELRERK